MALVYLYGCVNRPPAYGAVPDGYTAARKSADPRFPHGNVAYDRPLTREEMWGFDLLPIPITPRDPCVVGTVDLLGRRFWIAGAGATEASVRLAVYEVTDQGPRLLTTVREDRADFAYSSALYAIQGQLFG